MRALLSLAGLLLVVAIVMLMAKKQLQAVVPGAVAPTAAGATPPTLPEQSRSVQQKVLLDTNRALEQGAARSSDAQP